MTRAPAPMPSSSELSTNFSLNSGMKNASAPAPMNPDGHGEATESGCRMSVDLAVVRPVDRPHSHRAASALGASPRR